LALFGLSARLGNYTPAFLRVESESMKVAANTPSQHASRAEAQRPVT